MFEIPETAVIAKQLNETVRGKAIRRAVANTSPHKFAFYLGDPKDYDALLKGRVIGESFGIGAMVEIVAGDRRIVFGDGAAIRYWGALSEAPAKHQLLIEFDDESALTTTIQMYGSVYVFNDGEFSNKYYNATREKPNPLTDAFDREYFESLFYGAWDKLSAKAFLATDQRIPGLGNGTLQDILFRAGINPKRKMGTLSAGEFDGLYSSIKGTLAEMARLGGRDTEKDIFGNSGGYKTILSKNTVGKPCAVCGAEIQKAAYMGGAVYWCPACQPI